jgi:hypothetical protein
MMELSVRAKNIFDLMRRPSKAASRSLDLAMKVPPIHQARNLCASEPD